MISINAETLKTMKDIDGRLGVFRILESNDQLIFRKVRDRVPVLCKNLEYVAVRMGGGGFKVHDGEGNKLHYFRVKNFRICNADVILSFYRDGSSIFAKGGSKISDLPSSIDDNIAVDACAMTIVNTFKTTFGNRIFDSPVSK